MKTKNPKNCAAISTFNTIGLVFNTQIGYIYDMMYKKQEVSKGKRRVYTPANSSIFNLGSSNFYHDVKNNTIKRKCQ